MQLNAKLPRKGSLLRSINCQASESSSGFCIGKECKNLAWQPQDKQEDCGRGQICIHKRINALPRRSFETEQDNPSQEGGRCLPIHQRTICGEVPGSCQKGWECLFDMFTSSAGYCSPIGAGWFPDDSDFAFKPRGYDQYSSWEEPKLENPHSLINEQFP
jgi:hypothetical protein